MKYRLPCILFALSLALVDLSKAVTYNFEVSYSGFGNAVLISGSDDPLMTTLQPGDDFTWQIVASDQGFWEVVTGGDFFPLMALAVQQSGTRTGDFNLFLRNDGLEVFIISETGSMASEVHIGTNTIALPTGLVFDEMYLEYTLTRSVEFFANAADPDNPLPVDTTLTSILPIFGAPELNAFGPGIIYAVPEPSTFALIFPGLLALAGIRRRGR